ncbi:MAG TPA: FimV/HubP family polar landmark protein, partial [Steroidobacteraceae bacterium]
MTAKSLKWTLAALIVGSPAAMALGLGDIHLHSSLNAPLDADIDLIGATADDLASLKAQVASRDTFQKNGLDWPAFLSSVTLKPMHTADGRDIIKVHSGVAITEPFVTLLVEINWARGQVSHEYTVLLDPPVYAPDQGQAAAPVAAPAVGASPRGGTIQREPAAAPQPSAPPSPPPAPSAANPIPSSSSQSYRVQRGDSLSRIASHEAASTSPADVRRWMVATYEGNPDSFDKNMNILRAGSVLRLPDAAALGAVSTGDALAEVRRQYAAWHSSAAPAGGSAAAPAAGNDAGRLHLVTPGTATGTAAAGGAAAAADNRALQGKIQQLQSQLDESQRLLQVRNADLARLQAQLAAQSAGKQAAEVPPPPPPAATPAAPQTASAPAPAAEQSTAANEAPASAPVATDSGATASAPAVRRRPHVVSVPVVAQSSGSILDILLKYWWALAALIVAGAALIGLRAWRERRQSSFDDSLGNLNSSHDSTLPGERESAFDTQPLKPLRDESMLVEESGSHMKPRFDGGTSTRAPHIAADQTISAETAVNLDQGDPLAEADFHMAYGLYDQAADLVRIAIARDPARRDLKLKLLEVFFVWGNKEQFLHSAHELASTRAEAAPGEWEKILIMGKQLAPEDPLFAAGAAVSGAAAAGVDLDLEGGQSSGIDFDVLGSPSAVNRAADDIDLDIGTAIGERDATAESAAAMATDKNLALHSDTVSSGDGTGSTQEMTAGRMAAARFGGLNDGVTQESPTIEQPLAGANGAATVRQKVEKVLQQNAHVDQTAELAIDDLGLDLNSLDTVDQPALGAGADAPTMVAGLDERSRRLLETAEHRTPGFGADPAETPTGSWQFDGSATDAPISIEGAEHDIGATASLAALSSDLDFNLGMPEVQPPAQANGHQGLDLDVGTATIPDAAFAQTQRLGTEDLALPDLEPVTMSEVGTKLDLARAYMDMGDPEGARNILEEVVTEGSVAQKQEAQRLIESLPG